MSLDLERAQHILILCGLAGLARYLYSEGQFSPRALAASIVLAAALGWAAVLVAEWFNLPAGAAGAVAGALAWLGPNAVSAFCRKVIKQAATLVDDK